MPPVLGYVKNVKEKLIMPEMKEKRRLISRIPVLTRLLLSLFLLLVISVIFFGLDNELGIVLGWGATVTLLVELTRRWRKIWYFLLLVVGTFSGTIFLSFLHEEIVYPLVRWLGGDAALQSRALGVFHEAVSLIILFFGPMGILVGIMGAAILLVAQLVTYFMKKNFSGNT
ncbi:MAG: hypothetical protein A2Y90_03095 [Chloroflexi bacterium RBG_13_52_12]|nr:MAG: hypothetical protein A2Y90_03095 [Chloroflexi bacterium RBG_13_52_12]